MPHMNYQTNLDPHIENNMSVLQTKQMMRGKEDGLSVQLDMTYITERIIAMLFPLDGQETTYKSSVSEMVQMLKDKHGENYMILNLSEKRSDMHRLHKNVLDFGWPDTLSPPLERLCNICKSIDSWLNSTPKNVAVIHCKGGVGRMAVVIAAYIDYSNICASDDQALDQFAMKHFYDDKLARVIQPSQRRYVHYFAGLLSGAIRINNSTLFLHQIIIRGIPNFDGRGGCRPFIKIYQGMQPIYMSNVFTPASTSSHICVTLDPCLQLRSDVLVKCFNKPTSSTSSRDIIFRCQFHTCAVSNNTVKFGKSDLDDACNDPRFPDQGMVEFIFTNAPDKINKPDHSSEIGSSLDRWNSYENFNMASDDNVIFDGTIGTGSRLPREGGRGVGGTLRNDGSLDSSGYSSVTHVKKMTTSSTHNTPQQRREMETEGVIPNGNFPQVHGSLHPVGKNPSGTDYLTGTRSWSNSSTMKSMGGSSRVPQERSTHEHRSVHEHRSAHEYRSTHEQDQLDEILKELLGDQMHLNDGPGRPPSAAGNALVPAFSPPSRGTITTESDNMRTTLSWQTTQAGPTKSATVTRQTVAQPAPHSKLESEQTRYRETMKQRAPPADVDTEKWGASERYAYDAPSYRENRRVETHSETTTREEIIGANSQRQFLGAGGDLPPRPSSPRYSAPHRDDYLRPRDSYPRRTASDYRNYASDSEDPMSWLEEQRSKLRTRHDGRRPWHQRSPHEKQLVAELKSAQNSYYTTRRSAQSDTEDGATYGRRGFPRYGPAYSLDEPMTDDPDSTTVRSSRYTFATGPSYRPPAKPYRSSAPTSPVIPERGDSSKEAVMRSHTSAREWLRSNDDGYSPRYDDVDRNLDSDSEMRRTGYRTGSSSHLGPSPVVKLQDVEEEIISLQPIGPGIQNLEPGSGSAKVITRSPTSSFPVSGSLNQQYRMTNSVSVPSSLAQVEREMDAAQIHQLQQQQQQQIVARPSSRLSGSANISPNYMLNQPTQMAPNAYPTGGSDMSYNQQMAYRERAMTAPVQNPPFNGGAQMMQYNAQQQHNAQSSGMQQQGTRQIVQPVQQSYMEIRTVKTVQPGASGVQQHTVEYHQPQIQPQFTDSLEYNTGSSQGQRYTTLQQQQQPTGNQYQRSSETLIREERVQPVHVQNVGGQWGMPSTTVEHERNLQQTGATVQNYQTVQHQQQQQYQQQQQQQHQQQQRQFAYNQESSTGEFGRTGNVGSSSDRRNFSTTGLPRSPSLGGSYPFGQSSENTMRSNTLSVQNLQKTGSMSAIGQTSPGGGSGFYYGHSRAASFSSLDGVEGANQTPRFVRDTSRYWHKPNMTREEASAFLVDKPPGSFVVRNSNSYPGAYGLAVKVDQIPSSAVQARRNESQSELIRHFLIEPTPRGVQLKGNAIEPVFASLAALVYQHTLTPMALPCKLLLPDIDPNDLDLPDSNVSGSSSHNMVNYAACNVLYINSVEMESLTGPEAVSRAIDRTLGTSSATPSIVDVQFKVSTQGITLTDNNRRLFFRRHYPINTVTYCGLDGRDRRWNVNTDSGSAVSIGRVFGFVARKHGSTTDNICHLFSESNPAQPATAIVNFINSAMVGQLHFGKN